MHTKYSRNLKKKINKIKIEGKNDVNVFKTNLN